MVDSGISSVGDGGELQAVDKSPLKEPTTVRKADDDFEDFGKCGRIERPISWTTENHTAGGSHLEGFLCFMIVPLGRG